MKNSTLEPFKWQDSQPNHIATPTDHSTSTNEAEVAKHSVHSEALSLKTLRQIQENFFSTVSRELQIPLCNMKMAIEVLALVLDLDQNASVTSAQPDGEESKAAHCLKILQNECDRQMNLVNDLLDLQRLKAGVYPTFFTEAVCFQEWLMPTLEPLFAQAQHNQQTLKIDLAPDLPPLITELTSLKRILTELVRNACQHSPAGETITLEARTDHDMLHLSISNTGVEIPAAALPHIFDEFYRIPNEDRYEHSGLGLGLAISQKLVERLQGSIRAESGNNVTRFMVQLPFITLVPNNLPLLGFTGSVQVA